MLYIGLRLRFVVPLAVLLIAYGGGVAVLTTRSYRDEILSENRLSTLQLASTIRRSTRHAMLESRRENVHQMIEEIGHQEGIEHVRVLNKDGIITYSADEDDINRPFNVSAEECYVCHDANRPLEWLEGTRRSCVFRTADGHRTLTAIDVIYNEPSCWTGACHVHPADRSVLGVINVGVSLEEPDHRAAMMTRSSILFGLASSVVICVLIGLLIHRFVSQPVHRLVDATRKIASGDLAGAIPITSEDELGDLAQSFNQMTVDLRGAHDQLSDWAKKLQHEVDATTRDLKRAQAQVVRSEKLSSLGLLAAGVAHELNSPLTGILTFSHLLARRMPDSSPESRDLDIIISQTNRCAKIIQQLLEFSRENAAQKLTQDLHVILEQALELVENQARFHNVHVERHFDRELPMVTVDASQMQQVFLNLLVNAAEAMPDGGMLTIETSAKVETLLHPDDCTPRVQIIFHDTGIGIPSDNLGKIFDPFFTSKDVGQGTGLGLAVSHGIVEKHGGTIEVASVEGEGTTFTITLPSADKDEQSDSSPSSIEVQT